MAIYGNPLLIGGGAGGINDTLPPLLNDFSASREGDKISVTASKKDENKAQYLAGAVWVYGDHAPDNLNDGEKIEVGRNEIVDSETVRAKKTTVSEIPSKSEVKFGRFGGNDLIWRTTKDEEGKQYLVFSPKTAQLEPFISMEVDAKEPENPDNNLKNYGNVDIPKTNLFQWLNSDAPENQWYSAQSAYDSPPSYRSLCGFLHNFTEAEKRLILTNQWNMEILGKIKSVSAKVVVPSLRQVGISGNAGTPFDIFKSNTDRQIPGRSWWTSTSFNDGRYLTAVKSDGTMEYKQPYIEDETVVACIAIDPNMVVSLNSDGIYEGVQLVKKEIVYPRDKNFYVRQFTYNAKKQYQTMIEGAFAESKKSLELRAITPSSQDEKVVINIPETDGKLHSYIYLSNRYYANKDYQNVGILLRDEVVKSCQGTNNNGRVYHDSLLKEECADFFNNKIGKSIMPYLKAVNIDERNSDGVISVSGNHKIFPLSITEVGDSSTKEGEPFPYFTNNIRRKARLNGVDNAWWLRSFYSTGKLYFVAASGTNKNIASTADWSGLRPAIAVSLDLPLKPQKNQDGSYDFYQ